MNEAILLQLAQMVYGARR